MTLGGVRILGNLPRTLGFPSGWAPRTKPLRVGTSYTLGVAEDAPQVLTLRVSSFQQLASKLLRYVYVIDVSGMPTHVRITSSFGPRECDSVGNGIFLPRNGQHHIGRPTSTYG